MTHETHHFLIAEHHVQLSFVPSKHNGMQLVPSLKHFRAKGDDLPEPLLAITVDDGLQPLPKQERHRIRTFDTGNGDTIVDRTDNGSYQFIIKDIEGRDCCLLIADHDFHDCHCALNGNHGMRCFGLNSAIMLCFAFAGARHQTILLHASLVRKDGYGYAFTAQSGTGKSTQVSMWLRYLPGCDLMNDDNPVIRIHDDGTPYIYGSPWSGKTPCYRNTSAPLGAITRIDRDTTNFVERLEPIEAFATILSGCSTMKWDEEIHHTCCDTVQRLVETIPTYSLHCLPNREAAEVCCKAIQVNTNTQEEKTNSQAPSINTQSPHSSTSHSTLHTQKLHTSHFTLHTSHSETSHSIEFRNDVFLPKVVELINEGHTVTLPLRGISMRPFLEDYRDKALLTKPQTPKVGDVVLAEIEPRFFVLHRLWAINGEHVTLLGDGNLSPEHCRLSDIKAVAIAFYRKGRTQPDSTDGRKWRTYSWLWMRLRPIRRYLLYIDRHFFKCEV